MEIINVVFSSDDNYAQLMGVAICSIFENKKLNYQIDIYVLDGGISQINKNKLNKLEKKYKFEIKYIKVDTSYFKNFYTRDYYSQSAYYRIMIDQFLPHIKKVLYFDCDIVALDDIYSLYNTDINNYLFAAVEDAFVHETRHSLLNIPTGQKYFNTGVLLMNLEKYKNMKAGETILEFIKENPQKLKYLDQDAINAKMWGNFLCLETKYNYISWINKETNIDAVLDIKDIKIIHYTGEKPWEYLSTNNLHKKYFYYLKKTPWRNLKYKNRTIKNIILKYTKSFKNKTNDLPLKMTLFLEKVFVLILSRKIVEKLKKVKRKLGIKLY